MRKTTLRIKMLYNEMGSAEKKIADWIFANPGAIIPLSISELAEQCGCGDATIVRFAKRLGCSGYQELKISLAQEEGRSEISDTISEKDSCFDIFEKVSNDIYCTLEMTKKALSPEELERAAKIILGAKRLCVFGLGNSAPVALDFQHKFLRLGCDVYAYCDNHMQAIAASHLCEDDAAIGISHSGSSRDVVEALAAARENGAKTIAVTNTGKSPILKYSDCVLATASGEIQYSILGLNSRIAQLAIINALYYYVVCRSDSARSSIQSTEMSLRTKKY
ncbi:MAG: MurR/RpiR family transcriptional regulator [Clostridia bacterium]|nr:MurR/RpiR family transcriptional regulator [Clostridia bacterium]